MGVIRVILAGATGKTGREIARGLVGRDDVRLVAAVARGCAGRDLGSVLWGTEAGIEVHAELDPLLRDCRADVLVDFTTPGVAGGHALRAVQAGVRPVVGTTGIPAREIAAVDECCRTLKIGAVFAPNFSVGAVLMARWAAEAARFFDACEIIELHHAQKLDAPSGTARNLAAGIKAASGAEVPIHSVRLPGLVAHHRVIFGGTGQTLTISHDSMSRESFVPGVLKAVHAVMRLTGPVHDLGELLDEAL